LTIPDFLSRAAGREKCAPRGRCCEGRILSGKNHRDQKNGAAKYFGRLEIFSTATGCIASRDAACCIVAQHDDLRICVMDLERDRANERITSLVVVPAEGSPTKRTVTRKLSDRQLALDECAATSGEPAGGSLELPAGIIVVQLDAWREELYRKGVLDRDAKSPREEFKRIRQQLQARGLVRLRDELVWRE
jgi:hypothetical protein